MRAENNGYMIAGIDEAGRGALVGPMVIAGIAVEKGLVKDVMRLKVKDSKMLTPAQRDKLSVKLKELIQKNNNMSSFVTLPVPPCKIDESNMNTLEARHMASIIDMLGADEIYIDALTSKPERFKNTVMSFVQTEKKVKIIAKNNADKTYPIVSAASIIAKVERDRLVDEIKKRVNFDFGVGYTHDARCIKFLETILTEYERPTPFIRWKWDTVFTTIKKLEEEGRQLQPWVRKEILKDESIQQKIKDFLIHKNKCKEGE